MVDKCIVFLCSTVCQRMKPVCVVGSTVFNGPGFHSDSDLISDLSVNGGSIVNGIANPFERVFGKIFFHFGTIKYQHAVVVGCQVLFPFNFNGLARH